MRSGVAELEGSERKLNGERDILRAAAKYSPGRRAGDPLPVHRRPPDALEVKRLCQTGEFSRSSFYAWEATRPARAARARADRELAERIRTVHAADRAHGAPRVTAELNDGVPAGD